MPWPMAPADIPSASDGAEGQKVLLSVEFARYPDFCRRSRHVYRSPQRAESSECREHDGVEQRSEEDPRAELPPAGAGVVDNQPHDRIVDRVENARDEKEVADEDRTDFADIGEVVHVEGGDDGVDEVLAESADSVRESGKPAETFHRFSRS